MPRRPMSLGEAFGGAVRRGGSRYQDWTNRKQATDRQRERDMLASTFRQAGLDQGERRLEGFEDRTALSREQFGHRQHMDFANQLSKSIEAHKPSEPDEVNSIQEMLARQIVEGKLTVDQAAATYKKFFGGKGGGARSTSGVSPSGVPVSTLNLLGKSAQAVALEARRESDPTNPYLPRVQPPMTPAAQDSLSRAFLQPLEQYGGYDLGLDKGQEITDPRVADPQVEAEKWGRENISDWDSLTPEVKQAIIKKAMGR